MVMEVFPLCLACFACHESEPLSSVDDCSDCAAPWLDSTRIDMPTHRAGRRMMGITHGKLHCMIAPSRLSNDKWRAYSAKKLFVKIFRSIRRLAVLARQVCDWPKR